MTFRIMDADEIEATVAGLTAKAVAPVETAVAELAGDFLNRGGISLRLLGVSSLIRIAQCAV